MSDMKSWEEMQINDMLVIDTIRKSSSDTIYFKDRDSRFIWNNFVHAKQLGAESPDELIGKTDMDYFPREFAEKAREVELEIMRTGKPILNILEELPIDEDNTKYYSASKYPLYDKNNQIVGTWGISRDITETKKLEKELERSYHKMERLARVDDLSGLYNRRYFYETLEKYASEFAIVILDTDKISAVGIAKKLVEQIANVPIILDGKREKITISAGLAMFDSNEPDLSDLLSKAERKLNKSKREGKNKVSF